MNIYRVGPAPRNHRNDPTSQRVSKHTLMLPAPSQPALVVSVVSCFFKPFRNFHPSQWVSKVQYKPPYT